MKHPAYRAPEALQRARRWRPPRPGPTRHLGAPRIVRARLGAPVRTASDTRDRSARPRRDPVVPRHRRRSSPGSPSAARPAPRPRGGERPGPRTHAVQRGAAPAGPGRSGCPTSTARRSRAGEKRGMGSPSASAARPRPWPRTASAAASRTMLQHPQVEFVEIGSGHRVGDPLLESTSTLAPLTYYAAAVERAEKLLGVLPRSAPVPASGRDETYAAAALRSTRDLGSRSGPGRPGPQPRRRAARPPDQNGTRGRTARRRALVLATHAPSRCVTSPSRLAPSTSAGALGHVDPRPRGDVEDERVHVRQRSCAGRRPRRRPGWR